MKQRVDIKTDDGVCRAFVFESGAGPHPSVLFFMDGVGIRPALFDMGERLASAGYRVLLPDLFYRAGDYEPMDAKTVFSDPEKRNELRTRFFAAAKQDMIMRDTKFFLDFLGDGKVGTTGYCMGGRMSIAAAGEYPDRIAAAAAYHPGGLATDAPDSPHLGAPKIKARVYVAGASDDQSFSDAEKDRLEQALTAAGVDHLIETYPAKHGWVPSDTPVHDPAQAERHWKTLLDLFGQTLRAS
jgi:carboxymethylenebutenolidase